MSSDDTLVCPVCGGTLKYRDTRPRIRKKEGGVKEYLMIRRLRCTECHRHHNELPDCLVPHKHYEAEVISGVIDGIVTSEDADSEDAPSLLAMLRWLQWFQMNLANIEGSLRNAGYRILGLGEELLFSHASLLDTIRQTHQCFLASNFPHFHRYDSLKSALYIHAVSKNINTFPKNQGRIRAAIAVKILDFTVMYR